MSDANGQQPIQLDIRTLKLRELRDIETAVGHKIAQEISTLDLSMDTVQGLLWIALRRQKPDATFDEAADLSFEDIINGITGPEEMPPSPTPPLEQDGSKLSPSGENGSTPRQLSGEPAMNSASSTA
jgi:hypothetical protein